MNKNTTKGLSEIELNLIARLTYEDKKIYSLENIKEYLPSDYKNIKNLITSLKNKKIFISLKNGVYIFVPIEYVNKGIAVNELIIPSVFLSSSEYYIGYSTMYNYYNLYEQKFQTVYVINSKFSQTKKITGINFKFIKVNCDRLFGSVLKKIDNIEIPFSTYEKTLIDLLYFNKPVGGIKNAIKIFEREINKKQVNIDVLIDFLLRFSVIKTRKIAGFFIEKNLGGKNSKLNIKIDKLHKSVRNSSLISITGNRKGFIDKRWRLIINDSF